MARYARRLTKEDLMKGGITNITKDCRVFKNGQELKLKPNYATGYFTMVIYDLDSNGNKIKVPIKRTFKDHKNPTDTYVFKVRSIGLHRAMWAWHYGEVPEGYVVDHVNNKHESLKDYHLSNLQLLTQKENSIKERECNIKEIPCKLDRPRSYYEEKLEKYEKLYEEAKENRDIKMAHKQRGNLSQTRARLRYYDNHRKEAEALITAKRECLEEKTARLSAKKQSVKDRKLLEQYKQMFKEAGNKGMWHQMCKVIEAWDSLIDIQKNHVWEVLHKFFRKEA